MNQFQDALGTWHPLVTYNQPRIVSLVPSLTELVCDLGLSPYLVGRTGFCIHPHDTVQRITKVGGTKDVNIEKIRRLAPTHIIVNIDENEKQCVEELAKFVPHVIVTHPLVLDDNVALFHLLGGIFNVPQRAQQLVQKFNDAKTALQESLPSPMRQQRVLYCIWKDPWMSVSASTYIADMLSQIGWQVSQGDQVRYPVFAWTKQVVAAIDLILLSSEPYRFTSKDVDELRRRWGKPVLLVDGEMMSWYGSRSILGIHYLTQLRLAETFPVGLPDVEPGRDKA